MAEVRVLHVEVTLARRDVHRLAGAATGKMDRRSHLRELDEIDQILERGVATTAVEIGDEGRTADRREHSDVTAKLHRTGRIARVYLEDGRCTA